jgi:uncharacterized circularly permuted ATP-grasp superfamily protein
MKMNAAINHFAGYSIQTEEGNWIVKAEGDEFKAKSESGYMVNNRKTVPK